MILKRLFMSKTNRPPLSLRRLIKFMTGKDKVSEFFYKSQMFDLLALNTTLSGFR
jgi:Ribosomal protein 60S L18 and 50S L18e